MIFVTLARRVANVKELKDPCEKAIAKCRPYIEKRKPKVYDRNKDEAQYICVPAWLFCFQKLKQQRENALRFRKRNKVHIQNLTDLCEEKANEYNTIQKRCSDAKAMGQNLEINVRESFYPRVEQNTIELF